ncbi:hypothetical protein COSO111634_27025 [Corallococcus soli]
MVWGPGLRVRRHAMLDCADRPSPEPRPEPSDGRMESAWWCQPSVASTSSFLSKKDDVCLATRSSALFSRWVAMAP